MHSNRSKRTGHHYRKTSAEIVSEAKSMLAGSSGARLVSTRRPITPREPRRQLYGRIAPPGRPPSAFSLRYLQFESRAIPCLEPINPPATPNLVRSEKSDTAVADVGTTTVIGSNQKLASNKISPIGKLPSLALNPSLLPASLDPLPDKNSNAKCDAPTNLTAENPQPITNSIVKDHPLKKRQSTSFEDAIKKEENIVSAVNATNTAPPVQIPKAKLTRSSDLLSQSTTETLLDMLKGYSGIKECTDDTVVLINGILTELYARVKGARGSWRGAVLGALYGLVECTSSKVLLAVARVVLVLCVTGSNLTGVCKLVFKVARNEVNDHLFNETDVPELLIDGLGRANPLEDPEACIYGYGAVRFLASSNNEQAKNKSHKSSSKSVHDNTSQVTNTVSSTPPSAPTLSKLNKSLGTRLARRGAIQLIILHLQILNEFGSQNTLTGPPLHALYQLSGALRALAVIPLSSSIPSRSQIPNGNTTTFPQIQETIQENDNCHIEMAGPHLVKAAEICIGEIEVQGNLIRTLSILSEIDNCCENLLECAARIGILLGPIDKNSTFQEKPLGMLSRTGYILGNIMARYDLARIQFFNNDVAMEYLLSTLEHFSNKKFSSKVLTQEDTIIDVLIKLVRIIANMAVNSEVGYGLGIKPPLGGILLNILLAANTLKGKLNSDMEELLLATLCALHNLCFYQNTQNNKMTYHPGCTIERQADLSIALLNILSNGPNIAKPEAARVLGNMTRSLVARESLCSASGMKILVKCLESEDNDLVATSCGVLVNLLSDWERRAPFRELRGPPILREVLQNAALKHDWLLAGIVCQALWNFLIDTSNVIAALGEHEADYIQGDLAEYLDEEKIFSGEQPDEIWEQFAMVATDLLERIQSCISVTNSPCLSTDDEDDLEIGEVGDAWGDKFKKWLAE